MFEATLVHSNKKIIGRNCSGKSATIHASNICIFCPNQRHHMANKINTKRQLPPFQMQKDRRFTGLKSYTNKLSPQNFRSLTFKRTTLAGMESRKLECAASKTTNGLISERLVENLCDVGHVHMQKYRK